MNKTQPEHTLIHNTGYDFLRLVIWMEEAETKSTEPNIAPYFYPVLGLLGACFAIEGYLDMVGKKVDPDWENFVKQNIRFKARVKRIYKILNKNIDFGSGIWQKVLMLFKKRNELVHPPYVEQKENRISEIPDIFQLIAQDYPASVAHAIANEAIDLLLLDANLQKLKDYWQLRFYSGPPRY